LCVFENINWREHNEAGGIPSLSKTNIYKIKVLVPPNDNIEEQQKIASCLSSLDAIITEQTEKIEQLKLHKKGLMQGLFPEINN
jgi:type I restriction enzyme S subunit